ncbi:MAG: chromate transporter [Synergistaceae bacterium]|uniref:chromate transporter n=1 Tax=Aminivibrio sp. TaxID=1872489 RepID=UPI001D54B56E|nr:chromate transporter [Synergistaceae bacterium]NCC58151.1 chromate transporter [Synergistales bacterium]MDD3390260.1 chromate transporter [Synergistaceae bacterium]MDD3688564.1 chromate transporter [Synergistaceae bacterium]MDD4020235.1 chromate transporter [Synergistaceae bacterium]
MSLFKVFVLFLRLGALTFGGGIVMIGLLERELRGTEKLSSEETMDMIIFATALPGPIAANLAWLAGEKLAGKTGAFTAVLGTVIPPFLTILFLSKFFLLHMNDPLIAAFFLGAACAVAVIIGGVVFDMTKISFSGGWKDMVVFAVVSVLLLAFRMSPFIALGAGLSLRIALGEEKLR